MIALTIGLARVRRHCAGFARRRRFDLDRPTFGLCRRHGRQAGHRDLPAGRRCHQRDRRHLTRAGRPGAMAHRADLRRASAWPAPMSAVCSHASSRGPVLLIGFALDDDRHGRSRCFTDARTFDASDWRTSPARLPKIIAAGLSRWPGHRPGRRRRRFLVVPALALLGGLPMPIAVGTSLIVIAMKSFAGLGGYLFQRPDQLDGGTWR